MSQKQIYRDRLKKLGDNMNKAGVHACLIPMGDFHGSEYISPYFGLIEYYTGFTGSAGTLLVLAENTHGMAKDTEPRNEKQGSDPETKQSGETPKAYFWTDGRYYLQAGQQLEGTGIRLMKSGMEGVPTVAQFLGDAIAERISNRENSSPFTISFDGRIVSSAYLDQLKKTLKEKNGGDESEEESAAYKIVTDMDLAGPLWDADTLCPRPILPDGPIWNLPTEFAGKSREDKLNWLREQMQKEGVDTFVMSALDEIAWLLNLRGSDIDFNPVFLSYLIITAEDGKSEYDSVAVKNGEAEGHKWHLWLYVNSKDDIPVLTGNTVCHVCPYEQFYEQLGALSKGKAVWADEDSCACRIIETLSENAAKLIRKPSPVILEKAVKNETEIENIKEAHIRDGVAVTKWICALKHMEKAAENATSPNTGIGQNQSNRNDEAGLTELSAADLLEEYRKEQPDYVGQSFAPIIAFREHGAIVHYEPTPETDAAIEFGKGDFLLADTGGHYLQGTTDITRTISLGKPSTEQKKHYTAVLKGHLSLLDAVFPEGSAGSSLDQLARQPLYRMGLDYRHGTGHGVGYLLNVHEGPNAFRMKYTAENVIKEGMVTSDEPGVYLEGHYGIRIESLILSVFRQETEYGRFLGFEPLTMVPFDRDAIEESMLTQEEKETLNRYHKEVFEKLAPYLTEDEREWLAKETEQI